MLPTCTDLQYVQGALPMIGEVIEDPVERSHEMLKRAASKYLLGIEVGHDIVREQRFDGGLGTREFGTDN